MKFVALLMGVVPLLVSCSLLGHLRPVGVFEIKDYGSPHELVIVDELLYVAGGHRGFYILDVSNPVRPTEIGAVEIPGFADAVAVSGQHAFIVDRGEGLHIIDISEPAAPVEVGFWAEPSFQVAARGSFVYLITAEKGIRIIDVSNPSQPQEVGFYQKGDRHCCLQIRDNYAYLTVEVAPGQTDLRILDITTPTKPVEISSIAATTYAFDLAVTENCAYIPYGGGFEVLNISDPSNPALITSHDTRGWEGVTEAIDAEGHLVYLSNLFDVQVVDLSNLNKPRVLGSFDTDQARDVAVSNGYFYVAEDDGVYVFQAPE
jgi:hypothetical protein